MGVGGYNAARDLITRDIACKSSYRFNFGKYTMEEKYCRNFISEISKRKRESWKLIKISS